MRSTLARNLVAALAIALPAFCWLASPSPAQQEFDEDALRRMADGLRDGTISIDIASDECRRHFEGQPSGDGFDQAMAGFLEVPEDIAVAAFCRSLVKSIKAGDLSADGLALVNRNANDSATAFEVGRLLRAIYFSHVVTTTASAEGRKPQ